MKDGSASRMSTHGTSSWHNIMAMLLDSHVVNRSSSPGHSGLNSSQTSVRVCPRSQGEWRRRDCGVAIPPGGVISCFLSLCLSLSGQRTHPTAKTSPKIKRQKNDRIKLWIARLKLLCSRNRAHRKTWGEYDLRNNMRKFPERHKFPNVKTLSNAPCGVYKKSHD